MPQIPKSWLHNCYTGYGDLHKSMKQTGLSLVSRAGLVPACAPLDLQVTDSSFTSNAENAGNSLSWLRGCYVAAVSL